MSELYEKMAKELIVGNEAEVKKLTQEAIDGGAVARDVLDNGLLAYQAVVDQGDYVGLRMFENQESDS